MRKKRKAKAFDIFYNEFKMLEKFIYIEKVMKSCNNVNQLNITFKWGSKVLWSWFDVMRMVCDERFGAIDGMDIWDYIFKRTSKLSDELVTVKNEKYRSLTTVVAD